MINRDKHVTFTLDEVVAFLELSKKGMDLYSIAQFLHAQRPKLFEEIVHLSPEGSFDHIINALKTRSE